MAVLSIANNNNMMNPTPSGEQDDTQGVDTNMNAGTIVVVRPLDVLYGKGKKSFNHLGNARFRTIIMDTFDAYSGCESISDRNRIVQSVIDTVHQTGGRFLRKHQITDHWISMKQRHIQDKVINAFRDMTRKVTTNANASTMSGHPISPKHTKILTATKGHAESQEQRQQQQQPYYLHQEDHDFDQKLQGRPQQHAATTLIITEAKSPSPSLQQVYGGNATMFPSLQHVYENQYPTPDLEKPTAVATDSAAKSFDDETNTKAAAKMASTGLTNSGSLLQQLQQNNAKLQSQKVLFQQQQLQKEEYGKRQQLWKQQQQQLRAQQSQQPQQRHQLQEEQPQQRQQQQQPPSEMDLQGSSSPSPTTTALLQYQLAMLQQQEQELLKQQLQEQLRIQLNQGTDDTNFTSNSSISISNNILFNLPNTTVHNNIPTDSLSLATTSSLSAIDYFLLKQQQQVQAQQTNFQQQQQFTIADLTPSLSHGNTIATNDNGNNLSIPMLSNLGTTAGASTVNPLLFDNTNNVALRNQQQQQHQFPPTSLLFDPAGFLSTNFDASYTTPTPTTHNEGHCSSSGDSVQGPKR